MMRRLLPRVLVAACSLLALLWFLNGYRDVVLGARASAQAKAALATHSVSATFEALSTFLRAGRWNADPTAKLEEARFLLGLRRDKQAGELLLRVVHDNPGSIEAWALLASATVQSAPEIAADAVRHLRSLYGHPPGAGAEEGFLLGPNGVLEVVPGAVLGDLEDVAQKGQTVRFYGWAIAATYRGSSAPLLQPPSAVLLTYNGTVVASGAVRVIRRDVARAYHLANPRLGFSLRVPVASLPQRGRDIRLSVFGNAGTMATKLSFTCGPRVQALVC